jgi:type III secretion protein R
MESTSLLAEVSGSPLLLVLGMLALSLAPLALLGCTCFLKLSVVFSILRSALGAGQLPSAALTTFLSLCLTIFIMSPVAEETVQLIGQENVSQPGDKISSWQALFQSAFRVSRPLDAFLRKHSELKERVFFLQMSRSISDKSRLKDSELNFVSGSLAEIRSAIKDSCRGVSAAECLLPGESLKTLIPAFALSELKEAFAIGFTLFLPFLVIDLVVANMLVGLGMMMVSPTTVSLPFKLLLFFLCDGWYLLCQSLIQGYS